MIGSKIAHYAIERKLGQGGMGVVYQATDVRLDRPVALKVLPQELTRDPERRERFLREARAASAVNHPAIAQIYDVETEGDLSYIAMEYIDGSTVSQLISRGELDILSAVEIGLQAARALAAAHEAGIVHRDIKSDNLMVTRDGHPKVLDFGLAKLTDLSAPSGPQSTGSTSGVPPAGVAGDGSPHAGVTDDTAVFAMGTGPAEASAASTSTSVTGATEATDAATVAMTLTQAGMVMGTVAYMSPEQARGRGADPRSDIFSFGIVLYEMATGELPFRGESALDTMHAIAFEPNQPVTSIKSGLPYSLQKTIDRCLQKDPEKRYRDMNALAEDLAKVKREIESGVTRGVPLVDRFRELAPRNLAGIDLSPRGWVTVGFWGIALGSLILVVLFSDGGFAGTLPFLAIGSIVFLRFRSKRRRTARKFAKKAGKIKPVTLVALDGDQFTIAVADAQAKTYVKLNSLLDSANGALYQGPPFEMTVRDDLSEEERKQILTTTGVMYVRDDL